MINIFLTSSAILDLASTELGTMHSAIALSRKEICNAAFEFGQEDILRHSIIKLPIF